MDDGGFLLRTSADLDALDFDKLDGLVPVVTQDAGTGVVLMLAFADREALERTLATGRMHYRSRSRDELWLKGATSGNVQRVESLHTDCDADTVLARVEPEGPACHTGSTSCFGDAPRPAGAILEELGRVVEERARERPEGSYTVRLLDDENLRLKKLGEEGAELVAALARGRAADAADEAADLLYHLVVALRGGGVDLDAVWTALRERRG